MSTNDFKTLPLQTMIDLWEKAGYVFEASAELSLGSLADSDTIFTTGSRPVVLFSREISYQGDGFNAFIYRDPTYTGGTVVAEINNSNDVNAKTNQCQIITGATITDDGILSRSPRYVFGNTSVQGQGNTLEVVQSPQIVAPNSTLLLRIANRDTNTQVVASHLRWAEPPYIQDYEFDGSGAFIRYKGLI